MDFLFTEEQMAVQSTIQDFAKSVLYPKYTYWDRTGEFPNEVLKQISELGLLGLRTDPEFGGSKQDYVTTGLVVEEIAKGDYNCIHFIVMNCLTSEIVNHYAGNEIKDEWLPSVVKGEKLLGLSLSEPEAGSDAAAITTRAQRNGSSYILNGNKTGTSFAMKADGFILFAKTDPTQKAKGITCFLVPSDMPGVDRSPIEDMGGRIAVRGSIYLENVRLPDNFRIGDEGKGFYQVMNGFDYSRALLGLACIGAAEVTLEETIDYVKGRKAFGKTLSKYEGISFEIAEMHTQLEMARWLCYRTLWLRDKNLPHTKEAAMCKWIAPQTAVEVIHKCLLLHGQYGYTKDYPIEQRLRDVIGLEIGDGTSQLQKIIIARELMGRESLPY